MLCMKLDIMIQLIDSMQRLQAIDSDVFLILADVYLISKCFK